MTIPLFLSVGKSNYTFTRRAGSYVNGRWLDGNATTFTLLVTSSQHSGKDD